MDLRDLNKYIRKTFRMLSLQEILLMLHKGDYMASLDLLDAYFHIPIHTRHRQYLPFTVAGRHYQFKVLPFGLRSAPRVFTNCMAPVATHLRQRSHQIYPYLDDWLIKGASFRTAQKALMCCMSLFRRLGLRINREKSSLSPAQSLQSLRARLQTQEAKAYPSEERTQKIKELADRLRGKRSTSVRTYKSLLGMISSCIPLVPNCRLRMRPLQELLDNQWIQANGSFEDQITINPQIRQALSWWSIRNNLVQGLTFERQAPSYVMTSDASLNGWGAHLQELEIQGHWTEQETKLHINMLELKAVFLGLQEFLPRIQNSPVLVKTDSTTTMFYLIKQGGTKSKSLSAKAIWKWLIQHNISLQVQHVPGVQNTKADCLSRLASDCHEWELNQSQLRRIFEVWGTPTLDLFATRHNRKGSQFASRFCQKG